MTADIYKGNVVKISGTKANVSLPTGIVIIDAVIPDSLKPEGYLSIGDEVVVLLFGDNTSLIMAKANGAYA